MWLQSIKMKQLRQASLFSGIGALDVATEIWGSNTHNESVLECLIITYAKIALCYKESPEHIEGWIRELNAWLFAYNALDVKALLDAWIDFFNSLPTS